MDLGGIESFLVLCEELHFGRSAQRLHVSQSALSRQIATLESQIGGALFDRTSRRVTLTPLGSDLRDQLAPAYRQLNAAFTSVRAAAVSPAGELRIGFAATTAVAELDSLVVCFERAQPDCTVTLHEVDLDDSMGPLQSGDIDVIVCWHLLDDPSLTLGPKIAEYRQVLAVGATHPLAANDSVSVEVLADHPVPNFAYRGLADRIRQAMLPATTPSGRRIQVHPTPVRTIGEVASLITR